MDRKGFIQSLFVLAVAPKIIGEIGAPKTFTVSAEPIAPLMHKRAYFVKIASELLDDTAAFKTFMEQELDYIQTRGFDLSKPYQTQMGYEPYDFDFQRNLTTVVISQYYEKVS